MALTTLAVGWKLAHSEAWGALIFCPDITVVISMGTQFFFIFL